MWDHTMAGTQTRAPSCHGMDTCIDGGCHRLNQEGVSSELAVALEHLMIS